MRTSFKFYSNFYGTFIKQTSNSFRAISPDPVQVRDQQGTAWIPMQRPENGSCASESVSPRRPIFPHEPASGVRFANRLPRRLQTQCLLVRGQVACKPGSVHDAASPHRRWPFIWDAGRPAPHAVNPDAGPKAILSSRTTSLSDLAPGGACRAASVSGSAVGSYPTVSPLPALQAVCSLWRFP